MTDILTRIREHLPTLPDGSPSRPLFEEAMAEIEHLSLARPALQPDPKPKKRKKPAAKKATAKKAKRR